MTPLTFWFPFSLVQPFLFLNLFLICLVTQNLKLDEFHLELRMLEPKYADGTWDKQYNKEDIKHLFETDELVKTLDYFIEEIDI